MQPRTPELLQALIEQQRAARQASQGEQKAARQAYRREARDDYLGAVGARTASALATPAPFAERLVHFWSNHFAVSVDKLLVVGLAGGFEADAIRPNVLGRFEDLLLAVTRHPAMLLYLDQAQSIGPQSLLAERVAQRQGKQRGLNENLAREILELHTLGVRSGYTQADVTEFARALTGWSLPGRRAAWAGRLCQWRPTSKYRPADARASARGRCWDATTPQSGEEQAGAILHDLADRAGHRAPHRHQASRATSSPMTHRPARAAARVGLRSAAAATCPPCTGELVERAGSPAGGARQVQVALGLGRLQPSRAGPAREIAPMQLANLMNQLGQPVWRPGSPAGWDDVAATWAAPDALLRRVEVGQRMAAQAGDAVDARALAPRVLPGGVSEATTTAIARSESSTSALALLLVAPEFLRR